MWEILKENNYELYKNKKMELKLKVFYRQDCNEIYVNYKGFNIAFVMEIWGFGAECNEWNIKEKIKGDPVEDPSSIAFIIDKENMRPFIDLIYFFLSENKADDMTKNGCEVNW